MAQFNPYAMDPALAQGFSRLSKALIGDAGQDLDIARKNRIEELLPYELKSEEALAAQRNAGAYSNTQLGNKYKSETTGQDLKNQQLGALLQSFEVLEKSPEAAAAIMEATGINLTDPAAQSALVRALVGREGNIDQTSSALTNIGEAKNTRRAENIALDPNQPIDERLLAQQFLGTNLGQYSNPDFAETELTANNERKLQENVNDNAQSGANNAATNEANIEIAEINAQADVDEATINANATEAYNNYKNNLIYGEGGSEDRKQASVVEQQRWEHNNEVLEITVEPGKEIVLSPAAGQRLGLEPDDDGLYTLDGRSKPGAFVVKVGEEDVYLTKEDADALGIPVNDKGQYVIKGNPKAGSSNSRTNMQTANMSEEDVADVERKLADRIPAAMEGLPANIQIAISDYIVRKVDEAMGEDVPLQTAYEQQGAPIINAGVVTLNTGINLRSNIVVPKFFADKWAEKRRLVGTQVGGETYTREKYDAAIAANARALGYNDDQIAAIQSNY